MKKKYLSLIIAIGFHFSLQAQQVVSSMGGNHANGLSSLSFTVGEPAVMTFSNAGSDIREGYQQVNCEVATPNAIQTPMAICENGTGMVFSVDLVAGATAYTWTFPAGVSIVSGQGTNTVTVDWGSQIGLISVVVSNDCGTSDPSELDILTLISPPAPTSITGPTDPCIGTPQTYSVIADPNIDSYLWSIPSDAILVSGQGTPQIEIIWGANSGNIDITVSNACGSESASLTGFPSSSLDWVVQAGSTGTDKPSKIAIDSDGNSYVVGTFNGTVDFDPGMGSVNLTAASGGSGFLQKLDANGALLWVKLLGNQALDVSIDASGNVIAVGSLTGFGGADLGLTSSGSTDGFVVKFGSAGNKIWAFKIGAGSQESITAVALDSNDHVYVTGFFNLKVDFDPSASFFYMQSSGYSDVFVAKYSNNGSFVWASKFGGGNHDKGSSISAGTFVYAGGSFSSGSFAGVSNTGSYDPFILQLNPMNGSLIWCKTITGSGVDVVNSISQDQSGQMYAVGKFGSSADFDPSPAVQSMTVVSSDGFLLKWNQLGDFQWVKRIGGNGIDELTDVQVMNNSVYAIGYFRGNTSITGTTKILKVRGYDDICLLRYNENGTYEDARAIGGTGDDQGNGLAVHPNGDIALTGFFQQNLDFDLSSLSTSNLVSNGSYDAFVAKYRGCLQAVSLKPEAPASETENLLLPEYSIFIYPNPNQGRFTIEQKNNSALQIRIIDLHGKIVYSSEMTGEKSEIDISNCTSGIYVLQLQSAAEQVYKKIEVIK